MYHVEWVRVSEEYYGQVEDDGEQMKWITLEELKSSPIPTGLKKALALLEKSRNKKV